MPNTAQLQTAVEEPFGIQETLEEQQLEVEVKAALAGSPLYSLLVTTQMGITMPGLPW